MMDIVAGRNIHHFKNEVGTRFQLYSSLFTSLPFHKIEKTGILLSLFAHNCEMAMCKTYFPVTAYLSSDERFGEIWKMIHEEYILTKEYLLKLSGHETLMGDYPVDKLSIEMRERIVLPLVTIQQYAITKIRELKNAEIALNEVYGKLAMRCSFGIINAGRNSA
jgi:phosphoenolpyruvate carboxylase